MPDPRALEWGTCSVCGEAFPPNAAGCPTCGATGGIRPGAEARLPRWGRRRFQLIKGLRVLAIVGVIGGLGWATLSAGLSGPPTFTDPLTTSGWHDVSAGNFSTLSGPITGEDYIVGNYTVVNPPGAPLTLEVFNSTGFSHFALHADERPMVVQNGSAGRIVFAAPYTDSFYFVFVNGFAPTTAIDLHVYVVTNYESNVVVA
ncbi:MAG TPA: hypothetical protein VJQ43_03120 [Thermoplasmata archaeon]|nr:hypothetical protein [Thermoplasmata archaeon]